MIKKKKYRKEHKFFISEIQKDTLLYRLNIIMQRDEFGDNGAYTVTSLYFDDYKKSSLFTKISGENERFKWRIRFYDENKEEFFLERKEKLGSLVYKKRVLLSKKECENALYNPSDWEDDGNSLKKLFFTMLSNGLINPSVVVRYNRIAFVEKTTNTRICFDMQLSSGYANFDILNDDIVYIPCLEKGVNILEVKYDDILPSYIKSVLQCCETSMQSVSKFIICKKYFKQNIWEDQ